LNVHLHTYKPNTSVKFSVRIWRNCHKYLGKKEGKFTPASYIINLLLQEEGAIGEICGAKQEGNF